MASGGLSRTQRRLLGEFLRRARASDPDLGWLSLLVRRVGYAPVAQESADRLLATVRQLANGLGVSERQIRRWIRDGLPRFRESHGPDPALYDVFEVFRWVRERERTEQELNDDPLMGGNGPTGAWLEEYRRERTRQVKRENDLAEGLLTPTAEIRREREQVAALLRAGVERVREECGNEAYEVMVAVLDDLETEFARWRQETREPDGEEHATE